MDPEIRAALCALTDSTLGSGGRLEAGHAALEDENANHITNTRWATLSEFALDVTSDTDGSDTTEEARKRLQQVRIDRWGARVPAVGFTSISRRDLSGSVHCCCAPILSSGLDP